MERCPWIKDEFKAASKKGDRSSQKPLYNSAGIRSVPGDLPDSIVFRLSKHSVADSRPSQDSLGLLLSFVSVTSGKKKDYHNH